MSTPEVPLEQSQEDLLHHAQHATEGWTMGVALSAALFAVLAAITALLAEHGANEALLSQIQSSDAWNYYQARSIKTNLLRTKIELLGELGKTPSAEDGRKLEKYTTEQDDIKREAKEKQAESKAHLQRHTFLAGGLTLFQVAIAIGAIAVLTKRKPFWAVSIVFGVGGALFLLVGLIYLFLGLPAG
jgi:hypothetical protein